MLLCNSMVAKNLLGSITRLDIHLYGPQGLGNVFNGRQKIYGCYHGLHGNCRRFAVLAFPLIWGFLPTPTRLHRL